MRAFLRFLVVLFLLPPALDCGVAAAAGPPTREALSAADRLDRALLSEVLRAAGLEDSRSRLRYEAAFRRVVEEIDRKIGRARSPYRIARRLHRMLHEDYLRRYEATANGLDAILDRGEYNCVSASLFYGIVARAFGLDAVLVEMPRHVHVRLNLGSRSLDIESTSPAGFNFRSGPEGWPAEPPSGEYGEDGDRAGNGRAARERLAMRELPHVVDLERSVGFVWHNTGRQALERGDSLTAATRFLEEARLRPEMASQSDLLAGLLARAFRTEYEGGRFGSAYRIAEISLEIFPGQTSGKDRFLAAAMKRIDAGCEAGDPGAAERMLDQAVAAVAGSGEASRLERGACPLIAGAAVRRGDWDLATRMAERFAAARPDRAEADRLARWVAARERDASAENERAVCADSPSASLEAPADPALPGDFPPPSGSAGTPLFESRSPDTSPAP